MTTGKVHEMGILDVVPSPRRSEMRWDSLDDDQKLAIAEYGLYMYGLGAARVANIDEIKYDGRVVILDDGSRWEVDRYDADRDVQYWSFLDKVIVYDDVMYNVESAEHASVTEDG